MPEVIVRDEWTKRARAVMVERERIGEFPYRIRLMGPADGSGCMPAGESITHETRWRSTKAKAMAEAVVFCDARQIRITDSPAGLLVGY